MHIPPSITSVEEWQECKSKSDESGQVLVLQIGADWCKHCKPVEDTIQALQKDYTFDFVFTDASDSDLPVHFGCTHLPTIVLYNPQSQETVMTESVRTNTAPAIINEACSKKLILDEEF